MKRSSTKRPPEPTFYTDQDLGPDVPLLLRAAGLQVESYRDHFGDEPVNDEVWLRFAGERGWVALSHNMRIRYERNELDELMNAGVRSFFIIGPGPHAEYAPAILRNIGRVRRVLNSQREPFVGRVYQNRDEVDVWVTFQEWRAGRLAYKPRAPRKPPA